ncbi:MAG: hypothetical protein A2231_09455 [Candidatus Firestonebacteria bacterium RIFOXYA2_FULL_40_8]|nr:MAG: hypothetical protein A2231_09455 [Candidatus Firestonebacteria bacterium RIFOXYA2_FULL_40_8]
MEKLKYLPILMYHNVIDKKLTQVWNNFCIEKVQFEKQMAFLLKKGYTCLNFEDLENIIQERTECPKKPVIITLDDSYCETVNNVVPILVSKNMKCVFSVVTGYIGKKSSWEKEVDGSLTITEEQIKKYSGSLVSFESHTENHVHLTKHSVKEVERDLENSKKTLESITGRKVRAVFYPYGSYNANVKSFTAKAGYLYGLAIGSSKPTVTEDLFEMRRVYIKPGDSLFDFKRKISRWYIWFRGIREAYKRSRERK